MTAMRAQESDPTIRWPGRACFRSCALRLALALVVIGWLAGACGVSAADDLGAQVLKEKFERREGELLEAVRQQLAVDLAQLEKGFAAKGELEMAARLKAARLQVEQEPAAGESPRGFPLDEAAIAAASADGQRAIRAARESYWRRASAALAPAFKIYAEELAKIEKRLSAAADYGAAIETKGERLRIESQLKLMARSARLPEGAVQRGHSGYQHFAGPVAWHDARRKCEELGGHLVTIADQGESQFVRELAGRKTFWLGATDESHEGEWVWITGEPFRFKQWNPGSPDNHGGDQHYAYYWSRGAWDDDSAAGKCGFVCEWDLPDFF